uniref:Vitellogenin receptor-like n=1 Tax=Diabrotica virgifera virgifera TaxID=50390 RepID=A0A6P7GUZ8_DIAVI
MYWSDWGVPAAIGYSLMDGSRDRPFVTNNIHWPNGLALDQPNSRLYWTDAKKMTLESINLDGTDQRIVLEGIVKHPYAIAVFENKLYWSDWDSHTIQTCDKFNGKNHRTLVEEHKNLIYGISIFHYALKKRLVNPCEHASCSDICLLKAQSYACACPENKVLDTDGHTCKEPIDFRQQNNTRCSLSSMLLNLIMNEIIKSVNKGVGHRIRNNEVKILSNAAVAILIAQKEDAVYRFNIRAKEVKMIISSQ